MADINEYRMPVGKPEGNRKMRDSYMEVAACARLWPRSVWTKARTLADPCEHRDEPYSSIRQEGNFLTSSVVIVFFLTRTLIHEG
jgi:hypothetical protein